MSEMTDAHDHEPKEKRTRKTRRGGLFVNDAELIERLGVPENVAYQALRMLDEDPRSGFPKKDPFWGGKRYWPAVEEFLRATQMPKMQLPQQSRRSAA
jgi:hypothetical protein